LAGCRVNIPEHLDGRVTISYGPHVVARFADGRVENRAPLKNRTDHVLLKPDILTCYGHVARKAAGGPTPAWPPMPEPR